MQISGGNDELLRLSRSREKEIEQFLWGLRAGHTPFADAFVDPTPETVMTWLPAMIEVVLRVIIKNREALESDHSNDREVLIASHSALNDMIRERHAEFVEGVRDLRLQWMENMKPQSQTARTERKVGRNDPCPCGSGKKFKHCCLQ